MFLYVKKIRENAVVPAFQSEQAAGVDLCACIQEEITVQPGGRVLIPTGIAVCPSEPDVVLLIAARSGLAVKRGLTLSNGVGIVDADYRGEIQVGLVHLGDTPAVIRPGDRIAQLLILPILRPTIEIAESLPDTARGAGGFGSTGG